VASSSAQSAFSKDRNRVRNVRRSYNGAPGYAVGDKLKLIPGHCDPTVNLYDSIHVLRGDRVEAVWPIAARGKSQ